MPKMPTYELPPSKKSSWYVMPAYVTLVPMSPPSDTYDEATSTPDHSPLP
jgi:hypothetical protein